MRTHLFVSAVALAAMLVSAGIARAQDSNTPAPPPQQLVLEPVHSPFVVAPEYKITDFDGKVGQLVGAYVGELVNGQLLIGGAVYTMVNGSHDTGLTYGGFVIGWTMPAEARFRFGGRALVGGGSATLGVAYPVATFGGRGDSRYGYPYDPRMSVPVGTRYVTV